MNCITIHLRPTGDDQKLFCRRLQLPRTSRYRVAFDLEQVGRDKKTKSVTTTSIAPKGAVSGSSMTAVLPAAVIQFIADGKAPRSSRRGHRGSANCT